MPLMSSLRSGLLFNPKSAFHATGFPKTVLFLKSTIAMVDEAEPTPHSRIDLITSQNYPVPLSPQLPPISKQIELSRAMSASSKSSLFSLSRADILYEDEWLLAVNKPQGIYCESVLSSLTSALALPSPSDGLTEGTKISLPEPVPEPELHLANRLDRDTSGVMVITKSHKVAAKLVKAFTDHKVRKTYIALCVGSAPQWGKITVRSGHGRSKFGAWRVYATSDVGRTLPGGSVIRDMETSFEVLSINGKGSFKEPFESTNNEGFTVVVEQKAVRGDVMEDEILVRAYPRSGRTHQIRLHCQYLGISIKGDVKYEGVYEWRDKIYDAHQLHAESMSFEHPVTGMQTVLHAPLPLWANQTLQL
ncbi:RNA pseudouridine synthase 1 [Neltuma alba]|uniref:RNA pseudouridine synthase 1 n=2 Tax=Neltuma alba TaxID=207710 RepID=UPI0010A30502|nr:RNA pseudouridine synthase 1-like [Prosopis alba]